MGSSAINALHCCSRTHTRRRSIASMAAFATMTHGMPRSLLRRRTNTISRPKR